MKKFILIASIALLSSAGFAHAFDKEKFSTHLRRAFNLDSNFVLTVGDPAPSKFAGLTTFPVTIGGQSQAVYMTTDERYYFWGNVFDMTIDPDKDRWSKLKLDNVHFKGPSTATVTVVEFTDIQCPNCQKAHEVIDANLFKDFPDGKVRLIFKHFPLSMHEWAEPASVAAECAAADGNDAFWKMTDLLFKNGTEITAANLREKATKFAADLKLNKKKYTACLDNPATLEKIKKDKDEGANDGVNATPTYIVNGRMIRGNNYEAVKAAIEEKFKEAGK